MAGVDDEIDLILTDEVIEPISRHEDRLPGHSRNPRLHSDETLIALSISSGHRPVGRQAASSSIDDPARAATPTSRSSSPPTDEKLYRTLGINVCCEPKYEQHRYYHK